MSNGKGSRQRGTDPESRRRYAEGWDRVFGSSKNTKRGHVNAKRVQRRKPYPHWVCSPCGTPVCKRKGSWLATWHKGKCDVCGNERAVTEARDFGYPDFPGHVTRAEDNAKWRKTLPPESRALYDALCRPRPETD